MVIKDGVKKGRGAVVNPSPRYLRVSREALDDGWDGAWNDGRDDTWDDGWHSDDIDAPPLRTTVTVESPRTIISRNESPDLPFEQSINPYRGCEHGCVYCYARPTHAYLDLSPGLDFESRLFSKPNAAALLRDELMRPGYQCKTIALGANTDAYQPIERQLQITRSILEVLLECHHPVTIVTKSALIERDVDLLSALAEDGLVQVFVSITGLDRHLARTMEPRAAAPQRRLKILETLNKAEIPCGVMFAPIIPALNDDQLERVLEAAAAHGARHAGYVMLRMPHEIKELFKAWLEAHYPLRKEHVLARIRDIRGGRENDPRFGQRMKGVGVFAELIQRRFKIACVRLSMNRFAHNLDVGHFVPPPANTDQLELF